MNNLHSYFLAVGDENNWRGAFANGNIWGFSNGRKGIHWKLAIGDRVFFYVKAPVMGVVGVGQVVRKFYNEAPFFVRDRKARSDWPWRFEFELVWPEPITLFERTIAVADLINPRVSAQRLMPGKAREVLQRCDSALKF